MDQHFRMLFRCVVVVVVGLEEGGCSVRILTNFCKIFVSDRIDFYLTFSIIF